MVRRWKCTALAGLCATLLALSLACVLDDEGPDDTSLVGEFRVTGRLESNTCAPGFNPVSPSTFSARLFVDDGLATWVANGNSVTGTASGSSFHVVARTQTTLLTSCVLQQTETLDGTYSVTRSDGGSPDAGPVRSGTMTGTDSITFTTNATRAAVL